MKLNECVAIITGGSTGLGKGMATEIVKNGGLCLIADINDKDGYDTVKEIQQIYELECSSIHRSSSDTYKRRMVSIEDSSNNNNKKYESRIAYVHFNVCNLNEYDVLFDMVENKLWAGKKCNLFVNNAGIVGDGTFYDDDCNMNWISAIDINLTGLIRGSQVAFHYFTSNSVRTKAKTANAEDNGSSNSGVEEEDENGGSDGSRECLIINIGSMASIIPMKHEPTYTASKWGVIGITKAIALKAKEYNNKNSNSNIAARPLRSRCNRPAIIRVNALCPEFVNTAMGQKAISNIPEIANHVQNTGGLIPIAKFVNAFVQLIENTSLNGQAITISNKTTTIHKFSPAKL